MVELQKKQDKINAYKSGKSTATPGTASGREVCGESPARKTLPRLFNRMALKRQTTVGDRIAQEGVHCSTIDLDNQFFQFAKPVPV